MQDFKKLKVWKKSFDFAVGIYKVTDSFPLSERYGLSSQIQRASLSISSNIAEGTNRSSPKETNRFLEISIGSSAEVENLLLVASELGYIQTETVSELIQRLVEIRKMLYGLKKRLMT